LEKKLLSSVIFYCFFILGFVKAQTGTIDFSFNPGTGFNDAVQSVVMQLDGKIIISGWFTSFDGAVTNRIARLNSDGSLDTSFNIGSGFNGQVNSTPFQADGKIIVGGNFTSFNGVSRNRIARLNNDGTLDTTFNPGLGFNDDVWTTSIQADGKIIVGGFFSSFNGISKKSIARLNVDGSLDSGFNVGTGFNNVVNASAIQADGKILAGGNFNTYNGNTANFLVRLNINGSLDLSFGNVSTGFNAGVGHISIQNDNKLILTGYFSSYDGFSRNKIARLNNDGSIDTTFNCGAGFNNFVLCNAIQPDGKILVGGLYNFYDGISRNSITRLNMDGSIDTNFDPGTGFVNNVRWITTQQDGKILAGGAFNSYNGTPMNRIIRLNNDVSVGSDQNFQKSNIAIYPNPTSGNSTLNLKSDARISLINLEGQILFTKYFSNGIQELNLSDLSEGIYFLKVDNGNIIGNSKIIIAK
jgi:uncharacterized delta-60 repeat protein